MNTEQIQSFLSKNISDKNKYVKIYFQKRETLTGLFITEERDSKELNAKNYWRIVTEKNFETYKKSKDINLSRIFNGSEMTRLALLSNEK